MEEQRERDGDLQLVERSTATCTADPATTRCEGRLMETEALSATTTVPASADAVFAVLTDPARHASIDGTGWVCEAVDGGRLTHAGQVFRMGMYHPDHPDGRYVTANQVRSLDPSRAISWATGTEDARGRLSFGGWIWRYDLAPAADGGTQVRLTYDWSDATPQAREVLHFPPFGVDHLVESLGHLAALATAEECSGARDVT
jgi:uncharacterized protein YndB with AHSA1/START domain